MAERLPESLIITKPLKKYRELFNVI